jgi:hypothetical protein
MNQATSIIAKDEMPYKVDCQNPFQQRENHSFLSKAISSGLLFAYSSTSKNNPQLFLGTKHGENFKIGWIQNIAKQILLPTGYTTIIIYGAISFESRKWWFHWWKVIDASQEIRDGLVRFHLVTLHSENYGYLGPQ